MGILHVSVDYKRDGSAFELTSAGLVRTARKLASGEVFIPKSVWAGK
jgi:2-methylaconitate cis-trans-isomerase PrpF